MKKNRLRAAACVLCMSLLLGGCRIGNREIVVSGTLTDKQVFKIDKTACGLKEARVYLTNYQNIYGTAYGIDLWKHDFGENSLEKYVKDITLEKLAYVVTMDLLAESRGVALTEEEKAQAGEAAREYYASLSQEEIGYLGVTE
ncbi:MAG: peptidyl-prolyl cis-trans isomerase, partial [Roseburia sp.]|nr:peptidyl-prolyl cis-trans isomerase [Roseburia sp.]